MLQTHGGHGTPPIPSPARLGLSNPSPNPISSPPLPPPLSNPNNKRSISQPNNNLSSSSSSTTTSTSLLSLLPPLPRAQSLLLQMSSLSSRLFDLSPNRSHWSSSYRGSLPSFLLKSSSSSSNPPPPPSSPSSTKELLSILHSLQTQLFESVSQLQEILDLQDSSANLSRDIRSKDSALLSFSKKLRESESLLDSLIDDYSDYRSGRDNHLDLNEVLAYAHKISYTTFAPPEHGAGLAPLRGALPPAPQDNEMRASQLYHFADLDVGVPKKSILEKGKGGDVVVKEVENNILMEPTPLGEEMPVPGITPAMLPITVPAGWKPGDPVALPPVVPPIAMPVGWKPGDPVPLPPLDEVVSGVGREEGKMGVGRVMEKMPEVIQVRPVTLDIDQEDFSSDYSSDGSSDEEDDD